MKGVRCTVYALGLGLSGLQFFFERGADEVTFGAGDPIVCVCSFAQCFRLAKVKSRQLATAAARTATSARKIVVSTAQYNRLHAAATGATATTTTTTTLRQRQQP